MKKAFRNASKKHLLLLALAVVAGIGVRVGPTLVSEYPLNLGAFFYAIIQRIEQCGILCYPETIPYYGGTDGVPFAYPPLGFYVAAVVHSALPSTSLFTVLKALSIVLNSAAMVLFAGVAYNLLSRAEALAATFVFATVPAAFIKLVGTPAPVRTLGFVFLLSGAYYYSRRLEDPVSFKSGAVLGVFSALGGLCHPVMGVGAAIMSVVLIVYHCLKKKENTYSIISMAGWWGAAVGIVLLPYLVILISRGYFNFLVNGATSKSFLNTAQLALKFQVTNEPYVEIWGTLSIFGVFYAIVSGGTRNYCLVSWAAICLFLIPGYFGSIKMLPLSILSGPIFYEIIKLKDRDIRIFKSSYINSKYLISSAVAIYALGSSSTFSISEDTYILGRIASNMSSIVKLDKNRYNDFSEVRSLTGEGSVVFFLSNSYDDMVWGPALSGRSSFATPVGEEWTGKFEKWYDLRAKVKKEKCILEVLKTLKSETRSVPDYIFVQGMSYLYDKGVCREAYSYEQSVEKIYSDDNAVLWRVNEK